MADLFAIGVSGLNAAQMGLQTTENNITNASTPGYSREYTVQSSNVPQPTGSGYLGQGVNVSTVQRAFSQFLNTQLQQQQSQSSQLSTYYTQIQQINNVIASTTSGVQPAIQSFFSSVNAVVNSPGDTPTRQAMLGSAQTLVNQFQSLNQLMTSMNTSVNGQITSSVNNINSYAQQIASLNQSIVTATGATNQPPNALLDQRDQLVSQLSQEIQTSVVPQSNGAYSIFIGNGQSLVLGNQAISLQTVQSSSDPTKLDVVVNGGGSLVQQGSLVGGNLGGLLTFQNQTLTPTQDSLGLIATGLASAFNTQQSLGQDLTGAMGGNLFNVATPVVDINANNTGSAVVGAAITNVSALTGSDYNLSYDGTNYTLTRLSDNTTTTITPASLATGVTVDGVQFSLTSGTPNAGDSFLIRPTVNGAQNIGVAITDPSKIAAAVPVQSTAALTNTGTGTITAPTVNTPPPPNANLQQTVTITFNNPPTTFNVAGTGAGLPAANVPYTAGAAITYNGWTMQINGTPNANDVFTVAANSNATNDGNNALLMAGLETQNTLLGGTTSFEGAYGQLISQIGSKTNQMQVNSQAQANLVTQTTQAQQSVAGVNLNEEAANLIQYQQAYQAAGKAIQIASTLFDTVLNLQK